MQVSIIGTRVTLAIALCLSVGGGGRAWAENTPAPATPQPTLTADEKAILKKIILDSSADPDGGPAPLTVHFSAKPYDDEEAVKAKYVWNFGDGSKAVREQNPTHTYKKPGEYKASVKVTNAAGQAGTDDFTITVEEPETK